ncbi:hypothetical protein SARC_12462, partial [Sphaeroforma arctica JP610]
SRSFTVSRALINTVGFALNYYSPEKPNDEDKTTMTQFIGGLARHYPCQDCASHLRKHISKHPPTVDSNQEVSRWMCDTHNEVNKYLGKDIFDCSKVYEKMMGIVFRTSMFRVNTRYKLSRTFNKVEESSIAMKAFEYIRPLSGGEMDGKMAPVIEGMLHSLARTNVSEASVLCSAGLSQFSIHHGYYTIIVFSSGSSVEPCVALYFTKLHRVL